MYVYMQYFWSVLNYKFHPSNSNIYVTMLAFELPYINCLFENYQTRLATDVCPLCLACNVIQRIKQKKLLFMFNICLRPVAAGLETWQKLAFKTAKFCS